MAIIGIETSCDETAVAIVSNDGKLLSNVVYSQTALHASHGGIVPEIASRQHVIKMGHVMESAILGAENGWNSIDAVAVTYGPGLAGSLLVGLNTAKGLSLVLDVPLVGVNHIEGHIAAAWINFYDELQRRLKDSPLVCLVVSGGHTELVLMHSHEHFELIGETRDDAAGEAFDKTARILGLGYPGGPELERAAMNARIPFMPLPRAWLRNTYDFSFSGLKTSVLHRAVENGIYPSPGKVSKVGNEALVAAFADEIQSAVVDVLVEKSLMAAKEYGSSALIVAGGVAANSALRSAFSERSPIPVFFPDASLCTDNGAMIAMRGYFLHSLGYSSCFDLDVQPGLKVGSV